MTRTRRIIAARPLLTGYIAALSTAAAVPQLLEMIR